VEHIVEVEKVVEVTQIHKRIIQRPVEKIEEEIVEVEKVREKLLGRLRRWGSII
jgi:hypothetical protein